MEQTPEESVELEGSPQVSAPTTPPRSVKKRKEERRIEALQMTPLALHLESNASHHSPSGESKVLEETIDETKIDKIDGDSQRWLASQKSMNEDERDDLMLHLIAENDLLKQEMESLGDRVSELIGINERNFEHIAELVKETNSLRRQLQQEQNAHQRIRADYEMMRSRSSKLEIVAQDESFDAKRLRSLLDEKDTKIHDLYGEKRELNGMLGVLKRQLSASENEVKRHQADIRMFEREKMRMKAVIQEEREKIMSSIQSKRTSEAALKKLKLLVTTLQEKVHHFQSTQKNTDATVSSLQAKLDACVPYTEKEQLELALESERTKKEEMEIAYQSKLKEHIQLYTTETMKLRKENAKLRKRISLVQDELDKKKAKTADENDGALLPETKYSMGKGDKGKQIHDEDKGDGSGGEQEKVEEHVQKAEMESLKRELAESHQQLDDMVRSMAQMKESLADRSKSLHETQRRLRKVEKRKQILDDENKELQGEMEIMKRRNTSAEFNMKELRRRIKELEKTVKETKVPQLQLDLLADERDRISKENFTLSTINQRLGEELKMKEHERKELEKDLIAEKDMKNRVTKELEESRGSIRNLEKEIEFLHQFVLRTDDAKEDDEEEEEEEEEHK